MIGYLSSLVLVAAVFAKDLFSKRLSSSLPGTLSTLASFVFAIPYYLVMLPVLWMLGFETFEVAEGFFLLIGLRALSDTGAEWSKMESFSRADISLVAAFQSLSPAFLALVSPLITGDPITGRGMLGLFIIASAGLVMVRPRSGLSKEALIGVALGVMSAFFFAINHSIDRLAAQTSSAPLAAFAMTLLSSIFVLPFALRFPREDWLQFKSDARPLFIRGLFEVISMTAKLLALKYLTAPQVVGMARLSVLLSIVVGGKVFGEKEIGRRFLLGAIMVIGILLTISG